MYKVIDITNFLVYTVAPYAGAWIETIFDLLIILMLVIQFFRF